MSIIKVGDVFTMKQGYECVVIEYITSKNIKIKFLDGSGIESTVQHSQLRSGSVQNPYIPTLYGVGYVGEGKFSSAPNFSKTKEYRLWRSMLARCYDDKIRHKNPTYIDCTVHPSWHSFQNFAEWLHTQTNWDKDGYELDKDLLRPGNKEYGPDNCVFIPKRLNSIVQPGRLASNGLPMGVSWNSQSGKYRAQSQDGTGAPKYLGQFDCPNEAFMAYKTAKEAIIKQAAMEYRDALDDRVFNNLMTYRVSP